MEMKIPVIQLQRKRKDRGDPLSAATERPHLTIIMNNLLKVLPQEVTQSGMITMLGLLKSGKLILRCVNDRGDPDVTSWRATRESQLGFSHEETHHDGTTQSVVNEVMPRERSGRPDVDPQRGAWPQQFVIEERTNFKCYRRWRETFYDLVMFMTVTMESAVFMGKNYLNNCQSIANTTDLTLKQKFDISTRLVSEQDEISGLETIGWENHSWKYLSLIGDERVINLQRKKVYVFSDSVLRFGKILENHPIERCMGTKIGMVKIFSKIHKL